MKVGDLVKIRPEYTDEVWVDKIFVIRQVSLDSVIIWHEGQQWNINPKHVEVISDNNS